MLAKHWKRILLIILIVFCLINAIFKLLKVVSFDRTINALKQKVTTIYKQDDKEKNETTENVQNEKQVNVAN